MTETKRTQKTPESLIGQTLCRGEYTVRRRIGRGGMGSVYLASHVSLTIPLALKQLRADLPLPESVIAEIEACFSAQNNPERTQEAMSNFPSSGGEHTDRFLREALFLARLQHVAIPTLYDYFCEDSYWYLVMDYIPGQTLTNYLREHTPLPPLEAVNYAMQLCDVLHYLHQQVPPVIFRDLKPSNIMLTSEGTLMLVDFGIARYFKTGQENDTTDFGSPGYASPEQYQSEGQTDERSDLFSLGIILHEMLTGQRPTVMSSVHAALDTVRQVVPAISPALSGLVTLATRIEPGYRFQSARAFFLALERVQALEERRTYTSHSGQLAQASVVTGQETPLPDQATVALAETQVQEAAERVLDIAQEEQEALLVPLLTLEQRQLVSETLRGMRQQRLEREELEEQMASVDESLAIRAAVPLSHIPLPFEEESLELPVQRQTPRFRRVLVALFMLVMIIFLSMASLLIYTHFVQHPQSTKLQSFTHVTPSPSLAITPVTSAWAILPSLPDVEADNTVAYEQLQGRDYVYMSGGYRGPTRSPHYDRTLYRYDIAATHWEQLTSSNLPGMVNNAVARDEHGTLFFTAGYSTNNYNVLSLLYKYQPTNDAAQQIVPPSTISLGFGSSMLADQQGHLYMTEGFLRSGNAYTEAGTGWYRYDIVTDQWHSLAPLPQGLGYVVLTEDSQGTILLIGGATDAGQQFQVNNIYRYNPTLNLWTNVQTTTPYALSGSASCMLAADQEVIIGGYDANHNTSLNQTWLLNLHTLQWTPLAPLPSGGSLLGTATCDNTDHVYLVRGANVSSEPTRDFLELSVGKV